MTSIIIVCFTAWFISKCQIPSCIFFATGLTIIHLYMFLYLMTNANAMQLKNKVLVAGKKQGLRSILPKTLLTGQYKGLAQCCRLHSRLCHAESNILAAIWRSIDSSWLKGGYKVLKSSMWLCLLAIPWHPVRHIAQSKTAGVWHKTSSLCLMSISRWGQSAGLGLFGVDSITHSAHSIYHSHQCTLGSYFGNKFKQWTS